MEGLNNFTSISGLFLGANDSTFADCSPLPAHRLSCRMSGIEEAKRDLIAFFRAVFALLSILGTSSILISVVRRKQVFNPKVHTIFMLSIADFFLAVTWVVGGSLWMSGGVKKHRREGCFTINLITVILECVTMNLTCMYALLAYSSIKKKDFTNVYSLFDKDSESTHPWKPWRIIMAYVISWVLPVIQILLPFSIVAGGYKLVQEASTCSCWCLPYFGNVVPMSNPRDNDTVQYMQHMSMYIASYAVIVVLNYLVGFILLSVVYWKILKLIKKVKRNFANMENDTGPHKTYGVTSNIIAKGQSRARHRVILFLTVFVGSGFFNLLLSTFFVLYESYNMYHKPGVRGETVLPTFVVLLYLCQSITVPLQGFLNALVYGWTRDDFVQAIRSESVNAENRSDRLFREQDSMSSRGRIYGSTNSDHGRDMFYSKSYATSMSPDLLHSIPENSQAQNINF